MDRHYYSMESLSKELGVSQKTIDRWCVKLKTSPFMINHKRFFTLDQVNMLKTQKDETPRGRRKRNWITQDTQTTHS